MSLEPSPTALVCGLGKTGQSLVRHLLARSQTVAVWDSRVAPASLANFKQQHPRVPVVCGKPIPTDWLRHLKQVSVSPGLSLDLPALHCLHNYPITRQSEFDLFSAACQTPVIAITGTNGKSTVTSLLAHLGRATGRQVLAGGNLGTPVLDLLHQVADCYVVECSSFQLERATEFRSQVATILNITPDHLDRHGSMPVYQAAKRRIFKYCAQPVCSVDDVNLRAPHTPSDAWTYTMQVPEHANMFGWQLIDKVQYLMLGERRLLPLADLPGWAQSHPVNVCAALACGAAMGWSLDVMLAALPDFQPLAHRCQFVRELAGVRWYNDSKATNLGATMAAIQALKTHIKGQLILLLGGQRKGVSFQPLVTMDRVLRRVICFGEDGAAIANELSPALACQTVDNLSDAVLLAKQVAGSGDAVLLAPACASFDQFSGFEARGEAFCMQVQAL